MYPKKVSQSGNKSNDQGITLTFCQSILEIPSSLVPDALIKAVKSSPEDVVGLVNFFLEQGSLHTHTYRPSLRIASCSP